MNLAKPSLAAEDAPVSATIPTFSTPSGDTTPPSVPILIRPLDGTYTSNTYPEFVWYRSEDSNSNTVSYTFYLDGVATYLGIPNENNSAGTGWTSRVQDDSIHLTPVTALPDGNHSWFVRAYDASGNQTSSTNWSFVIDTVQPPVVVTRINTTDNPTLNISNPFEVVGTDQVSFTIETETYTNVRVTIVDESGALKAAHVGDTHSSTRFIATTTLTYSLYRIQISATDRANNTTLYPEFLLRTSESVSPLSSPSIVATPPGEPGTTGRPFLSKLPTAITQFPATVSQISSRERLALYIYSLIALIVIALLILLRRKPNIAIYNSQNESILDATVEHILGSTHTVYHLTPRNSGKLYIHGLKVGSELRITAGSTHTTHRIDSHRQLHKIIV